MLRLELEKIINVGNEMSVQNGNANSIFLPPLNTPRNLRECSHLKRKGPGQLFILNAPLSSDCKSDCIIFRYFPDDPWERYNRTSWWRHRAVISKNLENIKRYGNNIYLWDRFKADLKRGSNNNVLPKMLYMPPGYLVRT